MGRGEGYRLTLGVASTRHFPSHLTPEGDPHGVGVRRQHSLECVRERRFRPHA